MIPPAPLAAVDTLHQFLVGATAGDAITDHALVIQGWLRDRGYQSDIFAQHIHDSVADTVRPLSAYRLSRQNTIAIYHHSLGSQVAEFLQEKQIPLLIIHHNVTPPEFFARVDPGWAQLAALGQRQLQQLQPQTVLALADSPFNEQELIANGFQQTGVLPILLDERQYTQPDNPDLVPRINQQRPVLLFVGRLSPNKKQEDLIRLLYYYQRIQPTARLVLIGDRWAVGYDQWVEQLASNLGLGDAVLLTGKLSQQDMVTYYRHADLYISLSEHEGFGKPLLESMYLGLPVLAYGVTAVPHTMRQAGVLVYEKNYDRLAELVDILISDQALRQRLIQRQRQHVTRFMETAVQQQFDQYLQQLGSIKMKGNAPQP